jgi:ribulose-5-phosphate 4-epimerase/fuculose-1-phosphate aldolase
MATKRKASIPRKVSRVRTARLSAEARVVIDDLAVSNRILYVQDIVDGYGHISARHPDDPERFLMSCARAPGLVTTADIMEFRLDGEPVYNDGRPVYSERFIHSEIYKARPDVHSVVHSHSPTVVPFSVTQGPFLPIREPFLYPEVPVFDTRSSGEVTDLLISTPALGMAMAAKLGQNSVALLRGHGDVVVGPNVRTAVYRAIYTEANAKLLLQAKLLGGPITVLSREEADLMSLRIDIHKPGHGSDRVWAMWRHEALTRTGRKIR